MFCYRQNIIYFYMTVVYTPASIKSYEGELGQNLKANPA